MILGNTAASTQDDNQNVDAKTVQSLVIPSPCRIVAAYGLFRFSASGSQPFRVAIFDDSAGSPNNKLGVSDDVTISAGGVLAEAAYLFSFSTPVICSAATVWYGYHGGTVTGTQPIMRETGGSFKFQNTTLDTFSDGTNATFGTISGTSVTRMLCLYLVAADGQLLSMGAGA